MTGPAFTWGNSDRDYDWLKPVQEGIMAQKRQQQMMQQRPPSWATIPISQRYGGGGPGASGGMQHTGYGPDGQFQRNMPAQQLPNGTLVHEGELRMPGHGPSGDYVLDAGATQVLTGQTPPQGYAPPQGGMPPQQATAAGRMGVQQ
ncbi:MAG: hypothetical protein GF418_16055, partial [Chitinivibrionales bacterium]|nr:hypothetical protein [Chitinivibrionales bacterium]